MKPRDSYFLIFAFASTLAFTTDALSDSDPDLCAKYKEKVARSDRTVLDCKQSFLGKALTADFQAKQTGPLTANVSQIKDVGTNNPSYLKSLEKFYGVRNVKLLANCTDIEGDPYYVKGCDIAKNRPGEPPNRGMALLKKFAFEIASHKSSTSLTNFVNSDLFKANASSQNAESFEGSCLSWSGWSMDPEVRELFKGVKAGILCSGVPFTKGELKELMTAVYPNPFPEIIDQGGIKSLSYILDSKGPGIDKDRVEASNLALAKLGEFGKGSEVTPESILKYAEDAKQNGTQLMMDLDPGTRDIWNQPIEAVIDVSYLDNSLQGSQINQLLHFSDLQENADDSLHLKSQIESVERQLAGWALEATEQSALGIATLQKAAGEPVRAISRLDDQVDELKRLQAKLIANHQLGVTRNQVVKHRLFIQYGKENKFAQNDEVEAPAQALDYVNVNGQTAWLPPTRRMKEACKDGKLGSRVRKQDDHGQSYGLVTYMDQKNFDNECAKIDANPALDREIAVGAFPPKNIKLYQNPGGDARFRHEPQKLQAYNELKNMILHCEDEHRGAFHDAALFMKDVHEALLSNSLTPSQVQSFANRYQNVQQYLDQGQALKDSIEEPIRAVGGNPAAVPGLSSLYSYIIH